MKKLLLSLASVALCASTAMATEVTFNFLEDSYGLPAYNADASNAEFVTVPATITNGNVQILLNGENPDKNCWRMWNDGLRAYSQGAPFFTVSTTNGENVTGVVITSPKGAKFALAGTTDNISTWSGSASEVTFNYISGSPEDAKSTNLAVASITVVYGEEYTGEPEPELTEYSVTEALEFLNSGQSGEAIVYGVVTSVGTYNGTYGSLTYNIGDDVEATETIQVYAGLGLDGAKFSSASDVVVGAKVQVKGTLKLYTNAAGEVIPEMDMNSILLSYQLPDNYEEPEAPEGIISVADALDWIAGGYSGIATVKGYITGITEVSAQYGNATYTIKDDVNAPEELLVYRGYYLNGEKFTAEDQIKIGDLVIVEGSLVNYNGTYEFTTGSKILSINDDSTAIQGISSSENAPAVYYNLQGVRVSNPAQGGIYIIRQGDKTSKVVVR